MSEADLQRAVIDLCKWLGLAYFHDNDSRRNRAGFPDLVVLGTQGLLWRELKSAKGKLRPEQMTWLSMLHFIGHDAAIWRPADLASGRIKSELEAIR